MKSSLLQMISRNIVLLLCGAGFLFSCGVETGNPKKPGDDDDDAQNVIVTDSEAALATVAVQVDDTIDALTSEYSSSELSLMLFEDQNIVESEYGCEAKEDGSALVTRVRKVDRLHEMLRKGRVFVVEHKIDSRFDALWKDEGSSIACDATNTRAKIGWRDLTKLSRETSFSRNKSLKISLKDNQKIKREDSFTASGRFLWSWERSQLGGDGSLLINGLLEESLSRTLTIQTVKSGALSIESSLLTAEGAPLSIQATYLSGEKLWHQKKINGTVFSSQTDKSKVSISYIDIILERLSGCQPNAGKISGAIYNLESDTVAARTFVIDFAQENPVLSFDSGEEIDFEIDACELSK